MKRASLKNLKLTSLTYLTRGAVNNSTGWQAFQRFPRGSANSISIKWPVTDVTFMLTDWPIIGQLSNSKMWLYCEIVEKIKSEACGKGGEVVRITLGRKLSFVVFAFCNTSKSSFVNTNKHKKKNTTAVPQCTTGRCRLVNHLTDTKKKT